jgi:hypothetical protein
MKNNRKIEDLKEILCSNKTVKTYILATKGKGVISSLIRKYQRGFPYTHIAYVYKLEEFENPIIIEAWHLPVKFELEKKKIKIPTSKIFSLITKRDIEITIKKPKIRIGGLRLGYLRDLHDKGVEYSIFEIEVKKEQKDLIEIFLLKQLSSKREYDLKGIFGFATFSDIEDKKKWFCSELVFTAYKYAGIDLLKYIEPYKVSPRLFLLSPLLKKIYDGVIE